MALELNSKHALIQYFDLGMHNEGYWTYNHIALQMEDAFDVLSIVFPHCDFVFLAGELQCMQFIETDQGPFYLYKLKRE